MRENKVRIHSFLGETDQRDKKESKRADILFTGNGETTTLALGMDEGTVWSAHSRRGAGGLKEKQKPLGSKPGETKENEAF